MIGCWNSSDNVGQTSVILLLFRFRISHCRCISWNYRRKFNLLLLSGSLITIMLSDITFGNVFIFFRKSFLTAKETPAWLLSPASTPDQNIENSVSLIMPLPSSLVSCKAAMSTPDIPSCQLKVARYSFLKIWCLAVRRSRSLYFIVFWIRYGRIFLPKAAFYSRPGDSWRCVFLAPVRFRFANYMQPTSHFEDVCTERWSDLWRFLASQKFKKIL